MAADADPGAGSTPPALFSSKLVDVYKQNAPYIAEVVDAARSLLRLATEGLQQNGHLRHAPVRTHFRILSGAMFLLKVRDVSPSPDSYRCAISSRNSGQTAESPINGC